MHKSESKQNSRKQHTNKKRTRTILGDKGPALALAEAGSARKRPVPTPPLTPGLDPPALAPKCALTIPLELPPELPLALDELACAAATAAAAAAAAAAALAAAARGDRGPLQQLFKK